MWPFVLPAAALVAIILFLRSPAGRERRKGLAIAVAAAVVVAVVGVGLLGIPGAIVYGLSVPWVSMLLGGGYQDLGDGAWPAAIYISIFWPASLVIAYTLVAGPLRRRSRWSKAAVWILVPYAAGVAMSLWAHLPVEKTAGPASTGPAGHADSAAVPTAGRP